MFIISAFVKLRQEDHEFEASLGCVKRNQTKTI
jgi:hypothetical protein